MVMRIRIHLQHEGQSNPLRNSIIYENNHSHSKHPKCWGSFTTAEPKSSSSWTALAMGQSTRQVTFVGIQVLYALSTKGKVI